MARGETPDAENGFREFQRAKMSPQDTQLNTRPILPKIKLNTVKICLKWPLKKRPKIDFQDRLLLNSGQKYYRMEHSAILSTFFRLPFQLH